MTGQFIPKPGFGGPCRRACAHDHCAYAHSIAEAKCTLCGEPIGYETRFLDDETGEPFAPITYTHEICAAKISVLNEKSHS